MAGVRNFTDLLFWQDARQWSKRIFFLTKRKAFSRDRRLVAQINDSSESVSANVAEGFGRGTQGEFITFLGYAIGSLNETQSHLCAAYDREYMTKDEFAAEFQAGTDIRKKIVAFCRRMTKHGSGVKHIRKQMSWTEEIWQRHERITGNPRPDWVVTPESRAREEEEERRAETNEKGTKRAGKDAEKSGA